MPPGPEIPDKAYFRIGEAAEIVGVETYVLRFWESEFPQVSPRRAPSNQRLYTRSQIETLLGIKRLLHEQGYTIAGAKKALAEKGAPQATLPFPDPEPAPSDDLLREIKAGLLRIREMLD